MSATVAVRVYHLPSYAELIRRIESADDAACDGLSGCGFCELVVKALRGGSIMCDHCGHINAVTHSCTDWREYDAGEIDLDEVTRRSNARCQALAIEEASGFGHQVTVRES